MNLRLTNISTYIVHYIRLHTHTHIGMDIPIAFGAYQSVKHMTAYKDTV